MVSDKDKVRVVSERCKRLFLEEFMKYEKGIKQAGTDAIDYLQKLTLKSGAINIRRLIIKQFKNDTQELEDKESVFEFESELERSLDESIDSATNDPKAIEKTEKAYQKQVNKFKDGVKEYVAKKKLVVFNTSAQKSIRIEAINLRRTCLEEFLTETQNIDNLISDTYERQLRNALDAVIKSTEAATSWKEILIIVGGILILAAIGAAIAITGSYVVIAGFVVHHAVCFAIGASVLVFPLTVVNIWKIISRRVSLNNELKTYVDGK